MEIKCKSSNDMILIYLVIKNSAVSEFQVLIFKYAIPFNRLSIAVKIVQ